jgi:hypothetical protein
MKNWYTTLAGCIGAVAQVVYSLLSQGTVDMKTILSAVGLAVLGFLAKDFNVTGGTKQQ